VRAAVPLDVAQRAHLRHGRRAGGRRPGNRQARPAGAREPDAVRGGGPADSPADSRQIRTGGIAVLFDRAAVGRWHPGPGADAPGARARAVRQLQRADSAAEGWDILHVTAVNSGFPTLLTRRDGVVEYLTLNRPEVRN